MLQWTCSITLLNRIISSFHIRSITCFLFVLLFRERDHAAEAIINGVYSPLLFSAFPDQIRFLQRSQTHFVPRLRHTDDVDGLRRRLKRHGTFDADDLAAAEDPTTCTYSTHRSGGYRYNLLYLICIGFGEKIVPFQNFVNLVPFSSIPFSCQLEFCLNLPATFSQPGKGNSLIFLPSSCQ